MVGNTKEIISVDKEREDDVNIQILSMKRQSRIVLFRLIYEGQL